MEIDQGGVSVDDLDKYVGHHRLLFRRCLDRNGDPIGAETGYRVAVAALKMFKTRYDRSSLLDIARQAFSPRADYRLHPRLHAAAICSDYFNDAVVRVLERGAASAKLNPFTPADLSASSNMIDVLTRWVRLP